MVGTILSNNTVQVGDTILNCDSENLPVGSSISIAIRPEDIDARNAVNSDSNVVQIEVLHLEFLGSFVRAKLVCGDIKGITLRADFSISITRLLSIKVGSKLNVNLIPQSIRIYVAD